MPQKAGNEAFNISGRACKSLQKISTTNDGKVCALFGVGCVYTCVNTRVMLHAPVGVHAGIDTSGQLSQSPRWLPLLPNLHRAQQ